MTDHHDDDDDDDWRTVSVTPLTPGVIATVQFRRDETDTWQWPAVALLHQTRGGKEQIVLGVPNESGEVEACYSGRSDDHRYGLELIETDYGPYMKAVTAQHMSPDYGAMVTDMDCTTIAAQRNSTT